jgi:hypothetical protein
MHAKISRMPSMAHEILVDLFKNRPSLAAESLVEVLGLSLPAYTEARIASAYLTEIQPAETVPMSSSSFSTVMFLCGSPSSRSNWRSIPRSVSVGLPT